MVRRIQVDQMTLVEKARQRRREVTGAQLRSLRGPSVSQEELGLKYAPFNPLEPGVAVPQTTVSRWERGTVDLTLEQCLGLEDALGVEHGTLSSAAGYTDTAVTPDTIEGLLRIDPNIHPDLRADFLVIYRSYLKTSKRLAMTETHALHREEAEPRRQRA